MKVEPGSITSASWSSIESDLSATSPAKTPQAGPTTDSVAISGDVRLAQQAIQAAQGAPDLRNDVVARAQQLLQSGQLGSNLDSLASSMIDSLVNKS